ncbi:hypothetical protein ACROYT_G029421 [Oculina patagonica]
MKTTETRTVNMSEIFKCHGKCACPPPRTVFIEGKPGMGKTTYCKKLVHDWATGKQEEDDCFPRFEIVLLLRCRDMKSDLWEAIDDQLLPQEVTKDDRERFFNFIRHNQSKVLLILDGLDEVPVNKLPMFANIIWGRVLPKCRLVATAQHKAEINVTIRRYCDSLLEIEGFTEEDAREFIVKYFKTMENLAQKLSSKLKNDKNLKEMTANPLNTALLCLVCDKCRGVFPETGTELFMEIVQYILRRYIQKKGLENNENNENNKDLIEAYKPQLKHLGWIALNGLREGNLDFDKRELGSYSADLPGFGFLSGDTTLGAFQRYSFLHTIFQKFFAAFYLCCQLLDKEDKETSPDLLVAEGRYSHELNEVIPFVFGMLTARCQETAVALIKSISTTFKQKVKTDGDDHLYRYVLLECIKECCGNDEGQTKVRILTEMNLVLQLQMPSLDALAEWLNKGEVPPEIIARGPDALAAYNKALAEGRTFDKRVPVMLIGQERSGKTSLKKSLRGEPFNQDEKSTVGIDVGPSHFKVTTEIWKVGEEEQQTNSETPISFEHHAARATVKILKEQEEKERKERAPDPEERIPEALQSGKIPMEDTVSESPSNDVTSVLAAVEFVVPSASSHTSDMTSISSLSTSSQDDNFEENPDDPESVQTSRHPEQEDSIPKNVEIEMEKIHENDNQVENEDVYSVLWDFAGQSVYYTTHPLFLTSRAIYLLINDLSQDPKTASQPILKERLYKDPEVSSDFKTNFDCLDFWMSSVASLASQQESDKDDKDSSEPEKQKKKEKNQKLPVVFLVFTHADKPYGGPQCDPKKLAKPIYGDLREKLYKSHLYDFFVVDNTKSGHGSECQEVLRLREKILEVSKELPQMKEAIPIKWLKCEKELEAMRESGKKWITLETAKMIASEECNIVDDTEFRTFLNFLHDKRIVIHFDNTPELDKLVILDPQWLIDVFKKVITVKPFEHEEEFADHWEKLEEKGILEEELLKHVWAPWLDSKESLIAIMEKFSLLCHLSSSNESANQYLVPSMLRSYPPERIKDLVRSPKISPLFIKFDSGHVPLGFFPRLLLKLPKGFQCGKEKRIDAHLFKNYARFFFLFEKGNYSLILQCCSSFIKVVVHRGNDSHGDNPFDLKCAREVRGKLGSILESMRKDFFWLKNMSCAISFMCPVCCQEDAINYTCSRHKAESCKEEECLHLWDETQLVNTKNGNNYCAKCPDAPDNTVRLKQFYPWFADQLPAEQEEELSSDEGPSDERVNRRRKSSSPVSSSKPVKQSSSSSDYRVKDGNPEYDDLEGLANKILGNWKALGRRLLGNHEVVAIDVNKMECFDKAYEMLTQWKRSKGSEATFLVLYNALCHDFVKCRELAEEICCVNVDFQ